MCVIRYRTSLYLYRAGYDLRIDYGKEPEPPLESEDTFWSEALLRQAMLP